MKTHSPKKSLSREMSLFVMTNCVIDVPVGDQSQINKPFGSQFHSYLRKRQRINSLHLSVKGTMNLKICNSAEGPSGGAGGPPVSELGVLSRSHEVLAAVVVGVLVQGPVAVEDVAGMDVLAAETILH